MCECALPADEDPPSESSPSSEMAELTSERENDDVDEYCRRCLRPRLSS